MSGWLRWVTIIVVMVIVSSLAWAFWPRPAEAVVEAATPEPGTAAGPKAVNFAAGAPADGLPVDGWTLCEDLGMGDVPGLPDQRQRFKMCQPTGWTVRAYCLQPGVAAPPVGSACTLAGDVFTCGGQYQLLRIYRVVATPPAATMTATATQTATSTATPAPTQRVTVTPSATPTETAPPASTSITIIQATATRAPSPGGQNMRQAAGRAAPPLLLSVFLLALGLGAALWARAALRREQSYRQARQNLRRRAEAVTGIGRRA